jgi:uncharacterized membrane protein
MRDPPWGQAKIERSQNVHFYKHDHLWNLWTSALPKIADQFFEEDDFGKRS